MILMGDLLSAQDLPDAEFNLRVERLKYNFQAEEGVRRSSVVES
jgi:hypothetical protein